MKIIFFWNTSLISEDHLQHASCILPIFSFTIAQNEGEAASAHLLTEPHVSLPFHTQEAFLGVQIEEKNYILFKGRFMGAASLTKEGFLELTLVAIPSTINEQLQDFYEQIKKGPFWNPLFVDPSKGQEALEVLEGQSALFHWDRVTGQLSLSNLFKGRKKQAFYEKDILNNSLELTFSHKPLDAIHVNLTCEWTQRLQGEIDIGPLIAHGCNGGKLSTLTPRDLKHRWPQPNTRLGRSGFKIVESDLQPLSPGTGGALNLYPTLTPPLVLWDAENECPREIRLHQHWFRPKLVVEWNFCQKRQETVKLKLYHQTPCGSNGSIRTLNLRLQPIGDQVDQTFFLTDEGQGAIAHAIDRAKAHLGYSARCLMIEVHLPFEAGIDLTLDHSVTLISKRLPQGQVTGKVVAYRFIYNERGAYVWIRLAAVPSGVSPQESLEYQETNYGVEAYGPLGARSLYKTPSGIPYVSYHHQVPEDDYHAITFQEGTNLIASLNVQGEAKDQWQHLKQYSYPICLNTLEKLEDIPTLIQIAFKDLRTRDVLTHTLEVILPNPWSYHEEENIHAL